MATGVRTGFSSRNRCPPDWSIRGPAAVDAPPDWNIRGGTSSRRHGKLRRGHEDEAVQMQRSRVEDEAGEKRGKQDEDKAKVTQ